MMSSFTNSQKTDPSPYSQDENQKGKENKQDREENYEIKFLILELILAITIFCFVQISMKTKNEKLEILMLILSTVGFFIAVIIWGLSEIMPYFVAFLEERHLSLFGEKIQINSCKNLRQYAKKSAKASKTSAVKWLWFMYKEYHKQKKTKK